MGAGDIESSSLLPVTPVCFFWFQNGSFYCFEIRETFLYYSSHHSISFLCFEGLSPSLPTGLLLFLLQKSLKVYGRPLLILNGEGLWLKRRRHSKRMVPGNLFYCLKGKALLYLWWGRGWPIGGGCILSNSCLMDRLKDIKLVLLQRDSPIN